MKTVNISIVPINGAHRGRVVIMRRRDGYNSAQGGTRQSEVYRTGTGRQRLRELNEDSESKLRFKGGEGREEIGWQNNKAKGGRYNDRERHTNYKTSRETGH